MHLQKKHLFIGLLTVCASIGIAANIGITKKTESASAAISTRTPTNADTLGKVESPLTDSIIDALVKTKSVITTLSETSSVVEQGKAFKLGARFNIAVNGTKQWNSSNENVATVNQDGFVTAVAPGKCEITVSVDGYLLSKNVHTITVVTNNNTISREHFTDCSDVERIELDTCIIETHGLYYDGNFISYCGQDYFETVSSHSGDKYLTLVTATRSVVDSNIGYILMGTGSSSIGNISMVNTNTPVKIPEQYNYFKFIFNDPLACDLTEIRIENVSRPVEIEPNSITILGCDTKMGESERRELTVASNSSKSAVKPQDCFWSSSDTSVVKASSNGTVQSLQKTGTASITAEYRYKTSIKNTTNLSVDVGTNEWTILVYLTGQTYENIGTWQPYVGNVDMGFLSQNIQEMLSVPNQPSNVNIVIETGGCSQWYSNYGLKNNKKQRWIIRNNELIKVCDVEDDYSVASYYAFDRFLNWGTREYRAKNMGLVMIGASAPHYNVLMDENTHEVLTYNDFNNALHDSIDKPLEFIAYDIAFSAEQELAALSGEYAKYMVGIETKKNPYGFDYSWIKKVYEKASTEEIVCEISDSFERSEKKFVCDAVVDYRAFASSSVIDLEYIYEYSIYSEKLLGDLLDEESEAKEKMKEVTDRNRVHVPLYLYDDVEIVDVNAIFGALDGLPQMVGDEKLYKNMMSLYKNLVVKKHNFYTNMQTGKTTTGLIGIFGKFSAEEYDGLEFSLYANNRKFSAWLNFVYKFCPNADFPNIPFRFDRFSDWDGQYVFGSPDWPDPIWDGK